MVTGINSIPRHVRNADLPWETTFSLVHRIERAKKTHMRRRKYNDPNPENREPHDEPERFLVIEGGTTSYSNKGQAETSKDVKPHYIDKEY
jgi:hypothetical protein